MENSSRGKLVLKGGIDLKRKKKTKGRKEKRSRDAEKRVRSEEAGEGAGAAVEREEQPLVRRVGTGRITTSGTVVQGGEGTVFQSELDVGDAVIVQHPVSLQEETRIVTMVLSDVSIGISSGFSSDLVTRARFEFVKCPKTATKDDEQATKRTRLEEEEKRAFGTYAGEGGRVLTYRVKKAGSFGGYSIVSERVNGGSMSREELLERRCKSKSDRHCY